MATQIPPARQPVVESVNGVMAFTRTWYLFLQQLLTIASPSGVAPAAIVLSGSPFSYVAPDSGVVIISVGTVSLIEYGRGGTFKNIGTTAGAVPVSSGDTVRVTYTVAPTMTFVGH